ncbi:MAG: methylation-associated defense system protein MAD4 [Armatimonadota bacterium]
MKRFAPCSQSGTNRLELKRWKKILTSVVYVHSHHDSGVRTQAVKFLRPLQNQFSHALVIFDYEGCGAEEIPSSKLERELEKKLAQSGWDNRCAVIVIEPEFEAWVWTGSPHTARIVGLSAQQWQNLMSSFAKNNLGKPIRPKEAWEQVLKAAGRKPSARLFGELAEVVGLSKCQDRAFRKLVSVLQRWFPR